MKMMLPFLVSILLPVALRAAPIQFLLEGTVFARQPIQVDRNFFGLSGDIVELTDGPHRVDLSTPDGYGFFFTVTISNGSVFVAKPGNSPPNCRPALSVNWPTPTVESGGKSAGYTKIVAANPKFGAPTGVKSCAMASMASCNSHKVILKAVSEPKGAELWIEGVEQPDRTDVTLSVPYCQYERTKRIVLRFPGKINCVREIDLSPDAEIALNCALKAPQVK
jgi:hypothetical protein